MRLGVRGKLIFASLALIVIAGFSSGAYLEYQLRDWLESRVEDELLQQARTIQTAIEIAPPPRTIAEAEKLADRLGGQRKPRITLMTTDGTVVGDSHLSEREIRALDNHGNRPEVVDARRSGLGFARRHSVTIGSDLLYLALPYHRATGQEGIVRVALSLDEVDQAVARLRLLLLLGGLLGLGVAVLISIFTANIISRALHRLVDSARELARGSKSSIAVSSRDELGRLAGSFNRMADELERSMAALASERDRLETVLQRMTEAVLTMDSEHRLTMLNPAALKVLDFDKPPIGKQLTEAIPVAELHQLIERADAHASSVEFTLPGPRARRVLARAANLRESGGIVVVLLDVTAMRRLERVRKDFVANVSHELRTPISVIQANSETLLDGALQDESCAVRFVEGIHRNSERLRRLVADLLDLSRIEAGRFRLRIEPISVMEAVGRAMDAVEGTAAEKQIQLEVDVPADLSVFADNKALDQVLLNLLDNAIKYTEGGGLVVVYASSDDPENVRLEVRDNGPGIDPKHHSRIFERFYRVDPGRSRDMGGTGLGLAIVRHLVEAMQGIVGVKEAAPRGSVFWIRLPRTNGDSQRVTLRESPITDERPANDSSYEAPAAQSSSSEMREKGATVTAPGFE
jgi:two-component system phosphate regulon sensor histidine kinase PhoR